jgi:hypothetical protein
MPSMPPKDRGKLQGQFSSETIYNIFVILVTNKNNKDINLKNLSKYKVETDQGNKNVLEILNP